MRFFIVFVLIVFVATVFGAESETQQIRAKRRDMISGGKHVYVVINHKDKKSEEKNDEHHHMVKRDSNDKSESPEQGNDHVDPVPHSRLSIFP